MKKRFISKRRRRINIKLIIILCLIVILLIIFFYKVSKKNIEINDNIIRYMSNIGVFDDYSGIFDEYLEYNDFKSNLLKSNYIFNNNILDIKKENDASEEIPIIYIYNSHQSEEYVSSSLAEAIVSPTVMINDYIMAAFFNKNGYNTLVEENSIKDILNYNNWRYVYSYDASRILMEQAKEKNESLKYFIDVHRDSLSKDKTTVIIDGKSYAKTIFLIGLENPNYLDNLEFTARINDKLNEKYPGLSKGIYQKGGVGVNGVYNQDFSKYTILIEIGGYENTTVDVMNSSLAFAECFLDVISDEIV